MRYQMALGMLGLAGFLAGARPIGEPVVPHGTGKEGTPIEREFHLTSPVDPRPTDTVPVLPKHRWEALVGLMIPCAAIR